ncbi:MAG: GAF domain-containing protein [Prolixibacteraceae bacterium]
MDAVFERVFAEIEDLVKLKTDDLLMKICRLLKDRIYHYDWVGFYILEENELVLGPYAGKPTQHIRIPVGKGICGQVAEKKKTIVVQDVSRENNYISCSIDVQSEIVVPVLKNGVFVAELDIDSHSPAPFRRDDTAFLEQVCALLSNRF